MPIANEKMDSNRPKAELLPISSLHCGADETRTRDPMRDRHVF